MSASPENIRIMVLAGEVSGDMHAAALLRELRELVAPRRIEAFGIGGDRLRAEGVELFAHTDQTGVMGFWEVLRRIRFFRRLQRTLTRLLDERRPDLVLGIDYPGLNLRIAAEAKRRGILAAHYVCPQVWAWHRGRIPKIARSLDLLVTLFPFEPELFEGTGLRTVFAGNPLVDQIAAARRAPPAPLPWGEGRRIALFPGSRPNEVRRLLPDILSAARRIDAAAGPCSFLVPAPTEGVRELVESQIARCRERPERLAVVCGESRQALLQADAAIVKSGTSTLEACLLLCPEVVVYRVSEVSYRILRCLIRGVRHISLVNILAGKEVCREFIQHDLTPGALADEVVLLLTDTDRRASMVREMEAVAASLGPEGASRRAAEAIAGLLSNRK